MTCEPLIKLNLCDKSVYIGDSDASVTLQIKRGGKAFCEYELAPISGELFITDEEILDFGNEGIVFKAQLRDEDNAPIPFKYLDCAGESQEAEIIRLQFANCDNENILLREVCF